MKKTSALLISAIFLEVLFRSLAHATPVAVDNRGDLAGNDFVSWSQMGAACNVPCESSFLGPYCPLTGLSYLASPFNANSVSGRIQAHVTNLTDLLPPDLRFRRVDEGSALCSGWRGNFTLGDQLLYTTIDSVGPIVIELDKPVKGAGAQIQGLNFGTFTARIQVYNEHNQVIGDFTKQGQSSYGQDNSAIFLGVLDNAPTIKRIAYSVTVTRFSGTQPRPFAINQLDLVLPQVAQSIPTMSHWGLAILTALLAFAGVFGLRRQQET